LNAQLRRQIDIGFKRRDLCFVKDIFHQHKNESGIIIKERLQTALSALGVDVDARRSDELFNEFDTDNSVGLDLDEFQLLLKKSNSLCEWAKELPIDELLSDAIPRKAGKDQLRVVSELTLEERREVCGAIHYGLDRILQESCESLNIAFLASDQQLVSDGGSKFNVVSCGQIDDFHAGVEQRIGAFLLLCHIKYYFCF
jgi:hypothetical protein